MTKPTLEHAYQLARSGRFSNLEALKDQLRSDGCRAVDSLLAGRQIQGHLKAICSATFQPPQPS